MSEATVALTPILTRGWGSDRSWTLESYLSRGGYEGLKKAKTMEPAEIVETVKASGLRGRGGAGFPTGLKWSFLPPDDGLPRYLVVNADESEPGTCKDIPTIMANPHVLIEGIAITSRAINCSHAFVYLRGEVVHVYRRLMAAVKEATEAGLLGDLRITAHAGAGAYICGEETALLDSLEGYRGHPRLKPPFPAVAGLYARPTVINNVESISQVTGIFQHSAQWYASMGTEKSKGHGLFSISGHVKNPGQFEAPFGITMRELIELAGGIREGHQLKFWTPGGSSTPIFTEAELDTPLPVRCWVPEPFRSSTKRPPWFASLLVGLSSTSTNPAVSARPVVKEPTGLSRSCSALRLERARKAISICWTRSHTTFLAEASAPWAMRQQPRSCRELRSSAKNSRPG